MPVAVVTGSNRGIGLSFCKLLSQMGYEVLALCRKSSPELEKLGVTIEEGIDVTDEKKLGDVARKHQGKTVDLLLNNAGIMDRISIDGFDWKSMQHQFEINTLGPLKVTEAFLPLMSKGSKIGMITSRMGSIGDNTSGGSYGYRISKAGLNIASRSLAHDLKEKGIAVAVLHPGYVQTRMVDFGGDIDSDTAAKRLLKRIDELTLDTSGSFWHSNGEILPW